MNDAIRQFQDEYRFLSNFSPLYPEGSALRAQAPLMTAEHLFQAAKTNLEAERLAVMAARTPGEAKRLGQKVTLREDWDDVRVDIMREIVLYKFTDYDLWTLLDATGDRELVEGNTWGDTFWGVDLETGRGFNHLGKILMEVRRILRTERED